MCSSLPYGVNMFIASKLSAHTPLMKAFLSPSCMCARSLLFVEITELASSRRALSYSISLT